MKNHRIAATKAGGPDALRFIEEEVPKPQPGEVRVKVLAAGVSAYDVMVRSSRITPPKPPSTPGVDVVGIVDELDEGSLSFETGQRVATLLGFGNGGYSEYICIPTKDLVPVPVELDSAEAVCLVANYLTAHRVMVETAKLHEGEPILVSGASGGVGRAILDLSRHGKLKVIGTASARHHALVRSLGATPSTTRRRTSWNASANSREAAWMPPSTTSACATAGALLPLAEDGRTPRLVRRRRLQVRRDQDHPAQRCHHPSAFSCPRWTQGAVCVGRARSREASVA